MSSTYFLLTSMYGSGGRGSIATLMTRNGMSGLRSEDVATAHAVSATRAPALLKQQMRPGSERLAGRIRRSCLAKHAGSCLPA